jgi:hypothetical protein
MNMQCLHVTTFVTTVIWSQYQTRKRTKVPRAQIKPELIEKLLPHPSFDSADQAYGIIDSISDKRMVYHMENDVIWQGSQVSSD